jgi:hypothetical protein
MIRHAEHFRSVATAGCRRSRSYVPQTRVLAALAAILALTATGCGNHGRPALGQVHGHVTLDGKPLVHVGVIFTPIDAAGRDATGLTDENGEYVLKYIRDDMGAVVGKNRVKITKQLNHDPDSETVPVKYNRKTTLEREVKPGDNEIDFELTSK